MLLQSLQFRLAIIAGVAVAGLAVSSTASAACNDPMNCLGPNALVNSTATNDVAIVDVAVFDDTTGKENAALLVKFQQERIATQWELAHLKNKLSAMEAIIEGFVLATTQ